MCKWALHSSTTNSTFCFETKFPTGNTFYKYRIIYVFLSHRVCHNKTLFDRCGILHNMYAFKLYKIYIKCACKSFRTEVYKYVIDYMCWMKNAQIIWQRIVQFWNLVDTIFLYLQSEVLQFLAAYLQTETPAESLTNQPTIRSRSNPHSSHQSCLPLMQKHLLTLSQTNPYCSHLLILLIPLANFFLCCTTICWLLHKPTHKSAIF